MGDRGAAEGEPRAGSVRRVARRRAAGPRPVRPAAMAPAARPAQPMRPASRTVPVAVVVPLFGSPARERVLAGAGGGAVIGGGSECRPVRRRVPVPLAVPAGDAVRRFLAGLALMMAVAVAVVLLGLVAAMVGAERGGGAEGGSATTVMVSPDGGAATR